MYVYTIYCRTYIYIHLVVHQDRDRETIADLFIATWSMRASPQLCSYTYMCMILYTQVSEMLGLKQVYSS